MEQALRAVERLVEDQRVRLDELNRGHAQLEQALNQIRNAKFSAGEPAANYPRNPMRATTPSRMPYETDEASQTPRTEASRTPRSQRGEAAEGSRLVRSETAPNLDQAKPKYKTFRDDARYKETGKEYGPWPPYPEWQDLPLRRFGAGYGKKGVGNRVESHIRPGGDMLSGPVGRQNQHGDADLVDGMVRGIGHGKKKFSNVVKDHFNGSFIPTEEKDADRSNPTGHGHGKHHFWVKDHLNDESSTEASSSRPSRHSRRSERSDSSYTESSGRSSGGMSRPRSSRC